MTLFCCALVPTCLSDLFEYSCHGHHPCLIVHEWVYPRDLSVIPSPFVHFTAISMQVPSVFFRDPGLYLQLLAIIPNWVSWRLPNINHAIPLFRKFQWLLFASILKEKFLCFPSKALHSFILTYFYKLISHYSSSYSQLFPVHFCSFS